MKEYLMIVHAGKYQAGDVEECSDIIVCPPNYFHDCIDVLPVDMHGISGDVWYGDDMY